MKKLTKTGLIVLATLPLIASAQLVGTESLIRRSGVLVQRLITVVAGIALLVFFWGLVKYIFAQGNETSKADGKKIMGWGIVALFVMVSIWGIIFFIQDEFDLHSVGTGSPNIPNIIIP
ncbi:MAG: hypothetical protein A3G05_00970 [Candidatus Zambryskibacteria bacterium RIFCSPLOWO2_12_FULL_45_14]|uniref:Uncharacterized protein n=2 Tax=Candidatus Zambryskiibacteriota TaxID=1817925 RepID=A0A1G2UMZ9_9BACT|nr:MAG: hypothetical protein A3H60_00865 [Candidatus Zambryskibacteria bacterium RIFCSPLOWO2_02_FULL_44_12b]OHB13637.1 MAG: hypothetical protein A3G05_00970 [Candidatus Zambryskibacteria bacterium RIFCSPLOWO2_12_FULL_45_14]